MRTTFIGKNVLARRPERLLNLSRSSVHHVANALSHQDFVCFSEVFFNKSLSHYFSNLLGNKLSICCKDEIRCLKNKLTQELILKLCFLKIVSNWKTIDPEFSDKCTHLSVLSHIGILVFEHLANAGNSIVTSVVELFHLLFLFTHFAADSKFNCTF